MSFGRNLRTIFGSGETFSGLNIAPLKEVILNDDKSQITFEFDGAPSVSLGVEGDCCSHSWIEHLEFDPDVLGQLITDVEDSGVATPDDAVVDKYDTLQVYNTRFRTPKGDIVLEYRNTSNGYYGGYLVRLSK